MKLMVEMFKFTRTFAQKEPFNAGVVTEVSPGSECVTDEQIRGWCCETCEMGCRILTDFQSTSRTLAYPLGVSDRI